MSKQYLIAFKNYSAENFIYLHFVISLLHFSSSVVRLSGSYEYMFMEEITF